LLVASKLFFLPKIEAGLALVQGVLLQEKVSADLRRFDLASVFEEANVSGKES